MNFQIYCVYFTWGINAARRKQAGTLAYTQSLFTPLYGGAERRGRKEI